MKTFRLISLLLPLVLLYHLTTTAYADEGMCTEADRCLDEAVQAYKDGKAEEALQIFTQVSGDFDDPRIAGISSFMTGHIMGQIMLDGADVYLEKAHHVYPLIGDYALFRLAEIMESRDEFDKAADLYKEIYRLYPDSLLQKKSLLKAADSYLACNRFQDARDAYETYISIYPKDESVPSALYGIGKSYLSEDKVPLAFDYLERIWVDYPASPVSWSAKEEINRLREREYEFPPLTPLDSFIRGEKLFDAGLYKDALTEYTMFLSSNKSRSKEKEREAYFKTGRSMYNLRRSPEAEDTFESFLYNYPKHIRASEALYWLGRTYLRQGKEDAFIKSSKGFLKLYKEGGKGRRPEVLYRLGIVYADKGDVNRAISYYNRVMKEHPQSSFASDSHWAKGWLLYKEREIERALRIFNSILHQKDNSSYTPQALYWKAKALRVMNDHQGMEKSLCQLCSKYGGSFYCLFGRHYYNITCLSAVSISGMEVTGGVVDDYKMETSEDDPDVRIKILFYLGLKDEAIEEIQWLRQEIRKDKKRAIAIASILSELEEYNMALSFLYSNFSRDMLYSGQGFDMGLWRLMYPAGYSALIDRYAGEYNVDPFLLYALIREESWFNKKAVSSAGAIGLMQLMPETAASLMKDLYAGRESLFDPETNISLGTIFFSDLLRKFNGNIILALAGYNAGPVVVSKWLKERDGFELDEFIEDIPYKETRNYVKRVFTSYMEYLRMTESPFITSPPLGGGEIGEGAEIGEGGG